MGDYAQNIKHIKYRIDDIHSDLFYSRRKKRELDNLVIGIFLGIGVSLMIEAGLDLISILNEFRVNTDFLQNTVPRLSLNLSSTELALIESNRVLSFINFGWSMILVFLGFIIFYLSLFFFSINNSDLYDSRRIVHYEKLKKIKTLMLADEIKERIKEKIKNKYIVAQLSEKEGIIDIKIYHKIKRFLFEKVNRVKLDNNRILILYHNSKMGEKIGKSLNDIILSLEKENYFKIKDYSLIK